jgi:hypothetical protein
MKRFALYLVAQGAFCSKSGEFKRPPPQKHLKPIFTLHEADETALKVLPAFILTLRDNRGEFAQKVGSIQNSPSKNT